MRSGKTLLLSVLWTNSYGSIMFKCWINYACLQVSRRGSANHDRRHHQFPLHALCYWRPAPVVTLFNCGYQYALSFLLPSAGNRVPREGNRHNKEHRHPDNERHCRSVPKSQNQIPIALQPSMAAQYHPAVFSLKTVRRLSVERLRMLTCLWLGAATLEPLIYSDI